MVKVWDDRLKRLAGMVPQDFIKWLLPDVCLVRPVSLELKTLTRTVSTDILFEVRLHGKRLWSILNFRDVQLQKWRSVSGSIMYWRH